MLGIYFAISKLDITDQENMDLYLAIASCLTDQSLDLVSTQAFGLGKKAYMLLDQRFLGNADAREARSMIDITNITQSESESLISYLDRFEVLKNRLDSFNTINKCSFYTILCIRGLSTKFATFKDIITTGKTPSWELFKERLESHASMMSLSSAKTKNSMYMPARDSPNKVGQIYNTQLTLVCKRCLGRNHVAENCFSKKYCNFCKNASHNTFECSYKDQNGDYNLYTHTQENSYSKSSPHVSQRGNHSQSRGRGNTPKRPHFNTSKKSPNGRPPAQRGRRSLQTVNRQNNEVFSTANIHYRNADDTQQEYENEQDPINYTYNSDNDSSDDSNSENQMPDNAELDRVNLNNMFL